MTESEHQEEVAATVAVEIFGVPYALRQDGAVDAGRLRVLAETVDRKMREVAGQAPHLEPGQIAILAALNLANGGAELAERVTDLASDLEAVLDAPDSC